MLTDESLMPFGIHKDTKMANVPASYLMWLWNNHKCSGDVQIYISQNLEVLQSEIKTKERRKEWK